jgi:membrane protein implicated in regulation of membrane protease activity
MVAPPPRARRLRGASPWDEATSRASFETATRQALEAALASLWAGSRCSVRVFGSSHGLFSSLSAPVSNDLDRRIRILPCMATIGAAVLLALLVVPAPWGVILVVGAISWEVLEKAFWFHRTKRFPVAVGPEAMIGQPGVVLADCRPDGKVRLSSERWNATCSDGANVGEPVIVVAVERLTLIVSSTRPGTRPAPQPGTI